MRENLVEALCGCESTNTGSPLCFSKHFASLQQLQRKRGSRFVWCFVERQCSLRVGDLLTRESENICLLSQILSVFFSPTKPGTEYRPHLHAHFYLFFVRLPRGFVFYFPSPFVQRPSLHSDHPWSGVAGWACKFSPLRFGLGL